MAGPGRPKKDDARRDSFRFRMNEEEANRFDKICKEFGMNRVDTLRSIFEKIEANIDNKRKE